MSQYQVINNFFSMLVFVDNREFKHAAFLSHGRQPEVNILQARSLVSPRFSN